MNAVTLLASSAISFSLAVAPLVLPPPSTVTSSDLDGPTRMASDAARDIPSPEPLSVASEVVVVVPRPQARPSSPRVKVYGCSGWQGSLVGGSYKVCDWR